ncbi:MAG: response regulator [Oscillospiraceae bacterium]|nr:response regulator [Oscillospiraceae bacterium]
MKWIIYGMILLGSLLMVYNIYGFVRYARNIRRSEKWGEEMRILNVPIFLLVMFLFGYIAVGLFGKPDLIMAAILFGGSIFVFIMYRLIDRITERIMEREHLEARLLASEESSRAKNSFLASISHEMRTPVNVILGLDSIALKNPALAGSTRDQLIKIGQSGRHLLGLINNMLDLQRIETGELDVRQEPFRLRDLTDQINAIAGTLCEEKGLRYQVTIADGADGWYQGDSLLLKQVLLNLLENAVKFTDPPGSVGFSAERLPSDGAKALLRFSVTDTGIGIGSDYLPKVFELFSQEDTSFTTRFGGSGMGLAIAKNDTELMGGNIAVESQPNVGSTFTVTLPLTPIAPQDSAAGEETPDIDLEGRRILITEDIPENAEIAADLLELEGAVTEHAENGQKAFEMFQSSAPHYYDAILMDLRMPMMDGYEAARSIRALSREDAGTIPIIALTANASQEDVHRSMESGMNAHLVKPIDADLLYATLTHWIRVGAGRKEEA